jgi:hypothetical protein
MLREKHGVEVTPEVGTFDLVSLYSAIGFALGWSTIGGMLAVALALDKG